MAEPNNDDVKAMSFEVALAELEGIGARLEGGKAPLAARASAGLSLLLWVGVICCGRLLAYV